MYVREREIERKNDTIRNDKSKERQRVHVCVWERGVDEESERKRE